MAVIKVRINLENANHLTSLFRVGPVLASRIVEERDAHGAFTCPADLALRVDGITDQLAEAIAPAIDWSAPDADDRKDRNWSGALWLAFVTAACLYAAYLPVGRVIDSLNRYRDTHDAYYLSLLSLRVLWVAFAAIAAVLSGLFGAGDVTTSRRRERVFAKAGWICAGGGVIIIVLEGLAQAVYYSWFSPNGWSDALTNKFAWLAPVAAMGIVAPTAGVFTTSLPIPPRLRRILGVAIDGGMVFSSLAVAAFVWFGWRDTSAYFLIAFVPLALYQMWVGMAVVSGASVADQAAADYRDVFVRQPRAGVERWRTWFNEHLPSVDDQRSARGALMELYPPSWKRRLIGLASIAGAVLTFAKIATTLLQHIVG